MGEKSRTVHVRVTEEQWRRIGERSAELGCSAGSYIRHAVAAYALVSDATGDVPPLVGVETATMLAIDRELFKQGVNLNQIAHALNTSALAAARADAGLSEDDRRVLLEGVGGAALCLPGIRSALKEIQRACDEVAGRAAVAIPKRKRVKGDSSCP